MSLSAVIVRVLTSHGPSVVFGVIGGIPFGGLIGLINGFYSRSRIPPFIATLAMMIVAQGLALVISRATPIYFNDTPGLSHLSLGKLFRVDFPNAVLISPSRQSSPG